MSKQSNSENNDLKPIMLEMLGRGDIGIQTIEDVKKLKKYVRINKEEFDNENRKIKNDMEIIRITIGNQFKHLDQKIKESSILSRSSDNILFCMTLFLAMIALAPYIFKVISKIL